MLPPPRDRSFRVLKGCDHTSALGHELDDWGTDARSLGCSAGASDCRGSVNGERKSADVKRGLAYRLRLIEELGLVRGMERLEALFQRAIRCVSLEEFAAGL